MSELYNLRIHTDDPVWILATKQVEAKGYYSLWSLPRERRDSCILYAHTEYLRSQNGKHLESL